MTHQYLSTNKRRTSAANSTIIIGFTVGNSGKSNLMRNGLEGYGKRRHAKSIVCINARRTRVQYNKCEYGLEPFQLVSIALISDVVALDFEADVDHQSRDDDI